MTQLRSQIRGDMIIEVAVETPANMTLKQKQILEDFKKAGGEDASPKAKSFFAKVRELWDELKGCSLAYLPTEAERESARRAPSFAQSSSS